MKRGQVAVFLVVLFIAVIGVAVVLSGPSTTGMGFWGAPAKNLQGSCGDICLRDSDCTGDCSYCSPSLGRCISLKSPQQINTRYSWRIYQNRVNKCNRANMWCLVGARNDYMRWKCGYDLEKCLGSVEIFNVPEDKTSMFE